VVGSSIQKHKSNGSRRERARHAYQNCPGMESSLSWQRASIETKLCCKSKMQSSKFCSCPMLH